MSQVLRPADLAKSAAAIFLPSLPRTRLARIAPPCAAMVMPDRNVIWYDYQRVILPAGFIGEKRGVTVLSKRAPVDIKVI